MEMPKKKSLKQEKQNEEDIQFNHNDIQFSSSPSISYLSSSPMENQILKHSLEPKQQSNQSDAINSKTNQNINNQNGKLDHQIEEVCKKMSILKQLQFRVCVSSCCEFNGWLYSHERCPICSCVTIYMGCENEVYKGPIDLDVELFNKNKIKWDQLYLKELIRCRQLWLSNSDNGKQFYHKMKK